jgi:hypothetical protein
MAFFWAVDPAAVMLPLPQSAVLAALEELGPELEAAWLSVPQALSASAPQIAIPAMRLVLVDVTWVSLSVAGDGGSAGLA